MRNARPAKPASSRAKLGGTRNPPIGPGFARLAARLAEANEISPASPRGVLKADKEHEFQMPDQGFTPEARLASPAACLASKRAMRASKRAQRKRRKIYGFKQKKFFVVVVISLW
jgi:hypothetical protein